MLKRVLSMFWKKMNYNKVSPKGTFLELRKFLEKLDFSSSNGQKYDEAYISTSNLTKKTNLKNFT